MRTGSSRRSCSPTRARPADAAERVALLQRAARLYLEMGDAAAALGPLGEANKLQPEDMQTQLLMIDIALAAQRFSEATKTLDVGDQRPEAQALAGARARSTSAWAGWRRRRAASTTSSSG